MKILKGNALAFLVSLVKLFGTASVGGATSRTDILIGGLFNAFYWEADNVITRDDINCQHLAAFMMAVDEVNNKKDGIYDDLLNNRSHVNMALSHGQNYVRTYPANKYFDGTASVYKISSCCLSKSVGAVETTSLLAQATASTSSLNSFGTVSMLSTSTSSVFNDAHTFPTNLQIAASTFGEATVLVKLLSAKNGWMKTVFFITTDVVGIDSYAAFAMENERTKIQNLGNFFINIGSTNMTAEINDAKATGGRIFVFFLDGTTAGRLLEQGYNAGLFNERTQVVATSTSDIVGIRNALTPAGRLNEANILKGFMSTAPHPEYYFQSPLGQSFVTRFRNLPPTMTVDPVSNATTCSVRTTVKGDGSYDYRQTGNSTFTKITDQLCLGIKSFKGFKQDGSNIDPTVMYTYDAVYTFLIAANGLLTAGAAVTATSLYTYIVSNLFPTLITGYAYFIPGRGTRVVGNVFKVLNFKAGAAASMYSYGGLSFVGEYTDATGWLLCDGGGDMALMPPLSQSLCSSVYYRNSPEAERPTDAPPPLTIQLPTYHRTVLMVLASFGICTLAMWAVCMYVFMHTKQIRTSQPKVMLALLLGGVLGLVKVLLAAQDVTQTNCITQLWIAHIAFRLFFRTLILKLWRINTVVNAASFKRVIISECTVMKYLMIDIAALIFLLLLPITVISSVDTGMVGYISSTSANQESLYPSCQLSASMGVRVLSAILYTCDGIYFIMAMHYSVLTRTVPASVNEHSTIAPVIAGTMVVIVVVFVVKFTTAMSTENESILFNGAIIVVATAGIGLYFGKKMKCIYRGIRNEKTPQSTPGKASRNIERSFLQMVRENCGGADTETAHESESQLLHELVLLIGMLKKAHTPEAKLRLCNEQVTQWKSMLMLISDDLVSSASSAETDVQPTPPQRAATTDGEDITPPPLNRFQASIF